MSTTTTVNTPENDDDHDHQDDHDDDHASQNPGYDMKKFIQAKDWERTIEMLKSYPHLASEWICLEERGILWEDAPLNVILELLKAWPEVYRYDGIPRLKDLVQTKAITKQWEFLDTLGREYPQILATASLEDIVREEAPLGFLTKHWKEEEVPMLMHAIHHRDWERSIELLDNQQDKQQLVQEFRYPEYEVLWKDAPVEVVMTFFKAYPEWPALGFVDEKMNNEQWNFLDTIFTEFPKVIETADVKKMVRRKAPLGFLNKHWEEENIPMLSYSVINGKWEMAISILQNKPPLKDKTEQILHRIHVKPKILDQLKDDEFEIIYKDGPVEFVLVLLKIWSSVYGDYAFGNLTRELIPKKMKYGQWELLESTIKEFPSILKKVNVKKLFGYDAPFSFLHKYWGGSPLLEYSIDNKDWKTTAEILSVQPHLAQEQISKDQFGRLWEKAPLEVLTLLLQVWPEAYKEEGYKGNLFQTKIERQEWDMLDAVIQRFPSLSLNVYILREDWEGTIDIVKECPGLVQQQLSEIEYNVLWRDAPINVVLAILKAWPEAKTFVERKIYDEQWEFIQILTEEFPDVVTAADVLSVGWRSRAPLDVFKLMIRQQPNAVLAEPNIIFHLIDTQKLAEFITVLNCCPVPVTEVKQELTKLTPLLSLLQNDVTTNCNWIGAILDANPHAAQQKDFDGKTPLHLAYEHDAAPDVINILTQAFPDGERVKDNLGRIPKELTSQSRNSSAFTPIEKVLILSDDSFVTTYPDTAVLVCRGDMLMRDDKPKNAIYQSMYHQQVVTRDRIFETLSDEFSKMVGIDDKDVIQKAAVVQALASKYLSRGNRTVIDFTLFDNPGYWYQQEVLKLVMRVYHEGQSRLENFFPSTDEDAQLCLKHLESEMDGDSSPPEPSEAHIKAFDDLCNWLTGGDDDDDFYRCSFFGPVLKPLQSLFNKLFIRRGQTNVHVVGDMVRATLVIDDMNDKELLKQFVTKIETKLPNITGSRFQHPDTFESTVDFLNYVHEKLKFLPNSTTVLPYRFKANSSQKGKEEPLWFNFNFFLEMPEYHRVGQSEMFVACELQIGMRDEILGHRETHDAYERDRILLNQPLLKNYDDGKKIAPGLTNCSDDDVELIKKVLVGEIGTDVLVPSRGGDGEENIIKYETGFLELPEKSAKKPTRVCINNRSLNWHSPGQQGTLQSQSACVAAGPYILDETKQYFVESLVVKGLDSPCGTVGLYAHVGPSYMIEVACAASYDPHEDMMIAVESGQNMTYLEQVCPIPLGATAVEVIAYGDFEGGVMVCEKIELSLKEYDIA